ncbi:MAG: ribose 5-phosphate isomerase B [Holosporaceae bacterium]|jgi:ribose 5-phosphate isomerase B|nr:ribose 5-phosphate isomerase B [Holosporaceae bacterium]
MSIFIASDHAGFGLKKFLIAQLETAVTNLGTDSPDSCDYPIFAHKLVQHLLSCNPEEARGILICGTGIGMSMVANRYDCVRAALCFNEEMAVMARKHNNANVIVLGARIVDHDTALKCVRSFLITKFDGGRHESRLHLIDDLIKRR